MRIVFCVICKLSPPWFPLSFKLNLRFLSTRPGMKPRLQSLLKLYAGKKIIIGRDKLDVVKGVVQKLRAFAKLLHDYPEWIGRVLIQVNIPGSFRLSQTRTTGQRAREQHQ